MSLTLLLNKPSAGGTAYTLTCQSGSYSLSGTAVTLKASRKITASAGAYTYAGVTATLKANRKLTASSGAYTYTGTTATLTVTAGSTAYSLTAEAGSYTYSGTSVTLKVGRSLTAASGSYSYSGTSATVKVGRKITASAGSYSYAGTSATLKTGRKLTASSGSYTYAGTSATLKTGRNLTAQGGSYTYAGSDATLTKTTGAQSYVLSALSGSYSYNGTAAQLQVGRKLSANAGSYTLTGQTSTLSVGRNLSANAGAYNYTGSDATLVKTGAERYVLTCQPGEYVVSGGSATLSWSGESAGWDTRQGIARNKTTLVKFEKISDVEHVCAASGAASGVRQPETWASASTKPLQEGANCGYKVFQSVSANAFVKASSSGVLAGVRVLEPCADGAGVCSAVGSVSGSVRPVCSGDAESRRARSMQGISGAKSIVRAYGVQNPTDEQLAMLAHLLTRRQRDTVRA